MLLMRLVVPTDLVGTVLAYLDGLEPVSDVIHFPGASRRPPGDFVQCVVATESASSVVSALRELGLAVHGSMTLDRLDATVSAAAGAHPRSSSTDAVVWEEVEARSTAMAQLSSSYLIYMMVATVIAAIAILTDSVVLLIGAMLVGPEFGPLAGLCVGIVHKRIPLVRAASASLIVGFALAITASFFAAWAFTVAGVAPTELTATQHPETMFLSQPDAYTVVIAALCGVAGMMSLTMASSGTLIGVLISVTTLPAAGNLGIAAAYGNQEEALGSVIQLGVNVGVMLVAGIITLRIQRATFARKVNALVLRLRDARPILRK
jgi:uncharacterized hydrophobic protein (TIGR00271 family)